MTARIRPSGRFFFAPYSGLAPYPVDPLAWNDSPRDAAARLLRVSRAEGFTVFVLESGRRYEVTGPEDQLMVSDSEGLLYLVDARPCGYCGHDTNGKRRAFECRESGDWFCDADCAQRAAELLVDSENWGR